MAVSTIKNEHGVKFNTRVDITSYTSTPYVCPKDGYVNVNLVAQANAGGFARIVTGSSDAVQIGALGRDASGKYDCSAVFVRAGMEILVTGIVNGGKVYFYPLN